MFVYAVFAFAFMSGFFDLSENLYCRTLLECFITVTREGLLDTLGAVSNAYINYFILIKIFRVYQLHMKDKGVLTVSIFISGDHWLI